MCVHRTWKTRSCKGSSLAALAELPTSLMPMLPMALEQPTGMEKDRVNTLLHDRRTRSNCRPGQAAVSHRAAACSVDSTTRGVMTKCASLL